jgi:hypothetical protein
MKHIAALLVIVDPNPEPVLFHTVTGDEISRRTVLYRLSESAACAHD